MDRPLNIEEKVEIIKASNWLLLGNGVKAISVNKRVNILAHPKRQHEITSYISPTAVGKEERLQSLSFHGRIGSQPAGMFEGRRISLDSGSQLLLLIEPICLVVYRLSAIGSNSQPVYHQCVKPSYPRNQLEVFDKTSLN